jgi:hypothetical protein|uniref:Uncharacterized protein n=1 Tax=viral metagenome TaxID=1070528 RepID=A0A6C0JPN6_9ZZZZ
MENITMTEEPPVPPPSPETTQKEVRLIDVEITNENMAFNVLVSFLGVAQQRGTFSIAESAKIYECIQKFVSTKQE